MTKRIMRAFKMNEISAVDRPAQAGARMTIMKRDTSNDNENHGHERINDMTEAELQKKIDEAVKTGVASATADLTKKLNETTSQLEAITKAAPKKPKAADDMSEPDADDATAKVWRPYVAKMVEKAVAKAKEEFEAEIAKRDDVAKNDESFTGEGGIVIRKSDYAKAEHYTLAKAQQDRLEMQDFTKRAETEIPSLPGTGIAKAKALRAVSRLAKEDREAVEAMLKGGNAAMGTQMKALGKDGGSEGSAEGQLEKLAVTYAAENKVSKAVAYTKVLETQDGKDLYAKSLTEKPGAAA